jgi:hypothetical protein
MGRELMTRGLKKDYHKTQTNISFSSHASLHILFLNLILSQTSLLVFISRKIDYLLVCLCKHDNIIFM